MKRSNQIYLWFPVTVLITLLSFNSPVTGATQVLEVGDGMVHETIRSALDEARSGDTLHVYNGVYEGPLHIKKRVHLIGHENPVVEGNRNGTVVTIDTPGVTFKKFTIVGSGQNLNREDSGISVNAARCRILRNNLKNVLFGVYLRKADSTKVVRNHIEGYSDLQLEERGDLIRVWYSDYVKVSHNHTRYGRDAVIWFANNIKILRNNFTEGRYGLHFMYSDSAIVRQNRMLHNSVGAYLMYSRRLLFEHNALAYNRTGSGMGIGLKSMDKSRITRNAIIDNQIGIYIDNSPRSINSDLVYSKNVVGYNDLGLQATNAVPRSHFTNNSFMQNFKQVTVSGQGSFTSEPSTDWRKNYYSNYSGFDSDQNGFGELPYKATDFFAIMSDQVPAMKLYTYSPSEQALRLAARAFPLIRPDPTLKDTQPRMDPVLVGQIPAIKLPVRWGLALVGVILTGIGLVFTTSTYRKLSYQPTPSPENSSDVDQYNKKEKSSIIDIQNVTKSFGDQIAVDQVSFSVNYGESIALWGPNGAGKTTLMRCMLGIIPFDGEIRLAGETVGVDSKQIRKKIGFVPQNSTFYPNFTVYEILEFLCRLRNLPEANIKGKLEEVELLEHGDKKVRELSGGMRQRLALAASLLGDPPLLLLDEPMASLDLEGRRTLTRWLAELHDHGKTLILSTHHTDQIKTLAERVVILDQGKLAREISSKDFESSIQ